MRKRLCIILMSLSLLTLTGCRNSRKIETASIIENVAISQENGELRYTFYTLTGGDKPWGISVPANSFEEACELAEKEYIPNLTLSKLELLMIEDSVADKVLKTDIEYISTNSSFSPVAYVTLCDRKTIEKFNETTREQDLIEEQLVLLKNNNPDVNINYLSVFNNFESSENKEFSVGYITCADELKVSERKLKKD